MSGCLPLVFFGFVTADKRAEQEELPMRQPLNKAAQIHAYTQPPANISQMALQTVLGNALINEATGVFTPDNLKEVAITYSPPVDLEEMANGVVHPITKETMTKYAKIIKVLELQALWLAVMCKELGE